MTPARKASYALFAALAAAIICLHLGPVLLAGLFSYMILDLTHRKLAGPLPSLAARAGAVATFGVTAALLTWLVITFFKLAMHRMPLILGSLIPTVDGMANEYGIDLPFENLHGFRVVLLEALKENARSVTETSGLLTKGFFQIVVGIFVAILHFLSEPEPAIKHNLFDAMRREFDLRVKVFMLGFEKILSAQVLISFINAGITAIFLLAVGIPFVHFLTLTTFIFGILPIVGNIASNTVIVGTALTISPQMAVVALIFLVVSHKAQYLLSGHILGSRIDTPVWQILAGLLIGEALMGVPGMILAPAMIHYLREELRDIPVKA
ncbi:MAG: AI-2E family transporter [Elusimicrobia bacterium]|nr:AI-2E family transporter [Elusimicrobiota bacterium]